MRRFLFSSLLLASGLLGCGNDTTPVDNSPLAQQSQKKADSVPVNVAGMAAGAADAPVDTSTYAVSGRILVSVQYCGGVQPSPEMLEEAQRHHARSGVKVYLRPGTKNSESDSIVASAVSDRKGNFTFRVKPGTYCVLIEEQALPPVFDPKRYAPGMEMNNKKAYRTWWETPQAVVTITSEHVSAGDLKFHQNCMVTTLCPLIYNPVSRMLP